MSDIEFKKFASQLPNRPLGSINEIALLYSICSQIDKQKEIADKYGDINLKAETLSYLTPDDVETGESQLFIFAKLDLTGNEPKLAGNPVDYERYSNDIKYKVGYISNPGKAGAAIDYSLANHLGSSGSEVKKVAYDSWGNRFLRGRFENWAKGIEDSVVEDDWEYNITQSMREISEDESEMSRLEESLKSKFDDEEETIEGLVGIKVKVDGNEGFRYPAEFEEINVAGVENAKDKLREGRSVPSSSYSEDSVGYISDEKGVVVGASKGVLARYGKKQRDAFADLDATRGWQQRPLSEHFAKLLVDFNNIEDDFGFTIRNMFIMYLPYPRREIQADILEDFYFNVYTRLRNNGGELNPDEYLKRIHSTMNYDYNSSNENEEEIISVKTEVTNQTKKYNLFCIMTKRDQSTVYNTYFQSMDVNTDILTKLNVEYNDIVETLGKKPQFRDTFTNMSDSGFDMFDADSNIFVSVLYGSFVESVISESMSSEKISSDRSGSASDSRLNYSAQILSGDRIDSERLLQRMVNKTVSEHRKSISDGDGSFQEIWPILQTMVMHSLDICDLLNSSSFIDKSFQYNAVMSDSKEEQDRDDRLDEFVSSHEVLSDVPSKYAFILGGLVGRLSAYQQYNDISTTLIDKYPVEYLNKNTIKDVTKEVQQKNRDYESVENTAMNRRYMNRFPNLMQDPEDWEVSNTHIQWVYSLGIAYGRNDSSPNQQNGDKNDRKS